MGLFATSALSLVVTLLALTFSAGLLITGLSGSVEGVTPPAQVQIRMVWELAQLVCNVVVLVGAARMRHLRSHSFALTACALALIPCCGPCLVLGIPFGAWGLYVLRDPEVSGAFDRAPPPT